MPATASSIRVAPLRILALVVLPRFAASCTTDPPPSRRNPRAGARATSTLPECWKADAAMSAEPCRTTGCGRSTIRSSMRSSRGDREQSRSARRRRPRRAGRAVSRRRAVGAQALAQLLRHRGHEIGRRWRCRVGAAGGHAWRPHGSSICGAACDTRAMRRSRTVPRRRRISSSRDSRSPRRRRRPGSRRRS